jgi:hypothetical protein
VTRERHDLRQIVGRCRHSRQDVSSGGSCRSITAAAGDKDIA